MKTTPKFLKNKAFATALFFFFTLGLAQAQTNITLTLIDNTKQNYTVEPDGKLSFNSSNLLINTDKTTAQLSIPLSTIRKITFANGATSGVNEITQNAEAIVIFPNPASDFFFLQSSGTEKLNVRIFNTNGAQVVGGVYENGGKVDVSRLNAGIYVVVVNNNSFKLVKQ